MSLQNKAILIKCSIGMWSGQIRDNGALINFLEQHKMASDAGSLNKHLVSKASLRVITDAVNDIRTFHRNMTAPWDLEGVGLITSDRLLKYMDGMRPRKEAFDVAVSSFLNHYDIYKSDARIRLGDRFMEEEFPSTAYLKTRFYVDISPMPIPSSSHILVDLAGAGLDKYDVDKAVREAEAKATQRLWSSILSRMLSLKQSLETESRRFKATTLEALDDHVDKLRDFNFYKNEEIESFLNYVETNITCHSAEEIRKFDDVHKHVVKSLDAAIVACKPYAGDANGEKETADEFKLAA